MSFNQTFLDIGIFLVYFLRDNTEKAEVSGSLRLRLIQYEEEVTSVFYIAYALFACTPRDKDAW